MSWYGILKLVHVLSAIVWIGGGAAFAMVIARLLRAADRATLASMLPQVTRYMRIVVGPASGLVLLSGIAMVLVSRMGFKAPWIGLGFIGFILYALFGGLVMQKRVSALAHAVDSADDVAMSRAGSGVRQANVIYLLLMTAIVADMVLKPGVAP
jgi:uncharacterized membrane protein